MQRVVRFGDVRVLLLPHTVLSVGSRVEEVTTELGFEGRGALTGRDGGEDSLAEDGERAKPGRSVGVCLGTAGRPVG